LKQDRLSALRQRLKRGSFEFGALLEGVSTLEEDAPLRSDAPLDERLPDAEAPAVLSNGVHTEAAEPVVEPPRAREETPLPAPQALLPLLDAQPLGVGAGGGSESREDRLRAALDSLGCRFLQEMGSLRAALGERDVEEAGFHLAHLNQVVELLRDIDSDGSVSRQLGTVAAPPPGRTWPASCWTVVEFAGSPFSGLLPPNADELFVHDLLYACWGVTFERA
jgi:hypothetical protein